MPSFVTAAAWRQTPPAGSIHTPFAFNGNVGNLRTDPIAWLPIIESKSLQHFLNFFFLFRNGKKLNKMNEKCFVFWANTRSRGQNNYNQDHRAPVLELEMKNNRFFIVHNRLIMTLENQRTPFTVHFIRSIQLVRLLFIYSFIAHTVSVCMPSV